MKIRSCAATVTEKISEARKLAVIKYPEQEKIMAERKAFDTTRYSHQNGLINDLASLAIESSVDLPLEKRVNPFVLEVTNDGRVINPALGSKDVIEYYSDTSELDRIEKGAGIKIRDCLLSEPDGTLSIWISPPGGPLEYEEGRVVVGFNREDSGTRFLESYGICVDFSSQDCLEISKRLSNYTRSSQTISNSEDLRGKVFIITPPESKPWEFLREHVPMNNVWDSIESGQVLHIKQQAIEDAGEVARTTMGLISVAQSEQDYIQAGAYAETFMRSKGWNIASGACGSLNGDLLASTGTFLHSHFQIGSEGNVIRAKTEMGKFVKKCGNCGKEINKVIRAGYKCSCGGIYEGC